MNDQLRRYERNWQEEIDSAWQYRAMAAAEKDDAVARVYRELAGVEEKHATFWEDLLREAGKSPRERRPSWRARVLARLAQRLGPQVILPTVAKQEYKGRNNYLGQPETRDTGMAMQERSHARVLQSMLVRNTGASGDELARVEGLHRMLSGNALRAAVLGANDGLCSNLSLMMGVAGASVSGHATLLTGLAGLMAGACSMAIGEWLSVTSSRELADRELSVERDELELAPEEEREELQLIYEAKGLGEVEARELSRQLISDPRSALNVLSREELGLDPQERGGSPVVAAITSFLTFAAGAIVPVIPFFFLHGRAAVATSVGVGSLVLFLIGAAITVFTGRSVVLSGGRQLLLGLAAAGVTFAIGRLVGVGLG